MTTKISIKRLGFFTRLLDETSAAERYQLAIEQIQQAERCGFQNGVRYAECGLHNQRRQTVRQHRAEHQPDRTDTGNARGDHIILAEFGKGRRAHKAHIIRQIHN